MKRAVVLLSGGLDSATCLAIARRDGFASYALTIDYGQRHRAELAQAAAIARALEAVGHQVISLDLRSIGGSALTADVPVPKDRPASDTRIPATYVPARNTVFLALALGWAEVLGAADLFLGANAVDYSGYPDCRPEFIDAFERLANVATVAGIQGTRFQIHAPLLRLTKAEIIRQGLALGVDYGLTHSCYDPDAQGRACGHCDSCQLRRQGFEQAGLLRPDPVRPVIKLWALSGLLTLATAATPDPHASSAELVDVAQAVPRAVLELHYATPDNFLHRAVYAHPRCLLRAAAAAAIGRVEARLEKDGYRLLLWDCYRPFSVQKEMWKLVPQRGLVADPNKGGSHHNRGTAVDASLVDLEGHAVQMPSAHDDFTPQGRRDTPGLPAPVQKRRAQLRSAMEAEGFTTIRTEWWHFDAAGADHAPLLDDPL